MNAGLQTLFRVLPEERGKLGDFLALAAVIQAGLAVGLTTADSLFLAHLGPGRLPVIYLGLPVVMVVYAPLQSLLLARLGLDRLIELCLGAVVLGSAFFGLAGVLFGATAPWLLYAMKFHAGLWFVALYSVFWNFADDYFSLRDGKRLYGIIAAGGAAGGMAGAMIVSALSGLASTGALFLVWTVLALLALPLFGRLRRRQRKIEPDEEGGVDSPAGVVRAALATFRTSRFALGVTAMCFGGAMLAAGLEYLAMGVLAPQRSSAELARLLGWLLGIANLLTLLVNLFAFNRLVGRLGVGNTALILPLTFLAAYAAFFLQPGFAAAVLAFFAYQTLLTAVEYNNLNILFNALPAAAKRTLRTFIEAMSEPLATALAGGLLLALATRSSPAQLALAGAGTALGAVAVALLVRHDYRLALAGNLRRHWLDFSLPPAHWRQRLTAPDRDLLRQRARHSPDRAERRAACALLDVTGDPEAGSTLAQLVATAGPAEAEELRPSVQHLLSGDNTTAIAGLLRGSDGHENPAAAAARGGFAAGVVSPSRETAGPIRSGEPATLALAAVARWQGSRLDEAESALADVRRLLAGSPAEQLWGVRALGGFRCPHHAGELGRWLDCRDAGLRVEALRALHELAAPGAEDLLPRVLPQLAAATADERHLILGIVERVGAVEPVAALLEAAHLFSARERRRLAEVITSFGPRAIGVLMHELRRPAASRRARILAARSLARLAPPQLELIATDLMRTELRRARDQAAAAGALIAVAGADDDDGLTVLQRSNRDSAVEALDFTVQLLGLTGRLPDADLIQTSLTFGAPKDRANAIEAIEQGSPRALFLELQPLLALTAGAPTRPTRSAGPPEPLLRAALAGGDDVECAAAGFALRARHHPDVRALLYRRLAAGPSPRLIALLDGLLPGLETPAAAGTPALHPIERLAAFVRATRLAGAPFAALDYLAARSHELPAPAGESPAPLAARSPDLRIAARRGVTLVVPTDAVVQAIEVFPALGIALCRTRPPAPSRR